MIGILLAKTHQILEMHWCPLNLYIRDKPTSTHKHQGNRAIYWLPHRGKSSLDQTLAHSYNVIERKHPHEFSIKEYYNSHFEHWFKKSLTAILVELTKVIPHILPLYNAY